MKEQHEGASRKTDKDVLLEQRTYELRQCEVDRSQTEQKLQEQNALLAAIGQAQDLFISGHDPRQVYNQLLDILVNATGSAFGFLDEVLCDASGNRFLTVLALSDISWDAASKLLYEELQGQRFEIHQMNNLAGAPVITGRTIIANDLRHDPRSKGTPPGHPPLIRYMGIPLYFGDEIIGVLGVANRPDDYAEAIADSIEPLIKACTAMIWADRADRANRRERQNLAALRASEEKYRRLAENMSDVVWTADLNLRTTYVSPSIERMVGEPAEAHLQRTMEEKFPPDSLKKLQAIFVEELEKEEDPHCDKDRTRLIEVQHYRADGSLMWISFHVSFVRDANGIPVGFQGVTREITACRRMQEEQRKLRERLSQAVEIARLGYWEYDVARDLFIFDDAFYRIFRTTVDQVGGYNLSPQEYAERFVHPDDRNMVAEEVQRAIEATDADYSRQLEHRMVYADGAIGHINVRFFVVKDEQGRTVKTYGVNQDITERKQAEAERERLQAELLQARKMESVGRLAGGVAHEFNNMLGVIIGYTEMALDEVDAHQPLRASLQEILTAARRSAGLTQQLLAFARKQPVSPQVLDLNDTVEGMLRMLRRLMGQDMDLQWLPGTRLWPIKIDPSQLDLILTNLCANARDAIQGAGLVQIRTTNSVVNAAFCAAHPELAPGEYAVLSVADNGCGMDRETQERLFDPFFSTRDVGQGTGLGLATVYGIVKQNQGCIKVMSEPGKGSVFEIYLPRHRDVIHALSATPKQAGAGPVC